jgi:predicted alpha/beta hydrolase family esterase
MNAVIFHGTGGHPSHVWYGWLGEQLTAKGYQVDLPHYPELNKEPIATFLPQVLAGHSFGPETVLVGHSGGAALILALLEHVEVAQAVLVAGYSTPPNTSDEPVLQESYDWGLIKSHVRELVFVNSWTDPYGCDAAQGRAMLDHLGGTQVVRNDGHFGDWNQDYPTFELLARLIVDSGAPRST